MTVQRNCKLKWICIEANGVCTSGFQNRGTEMLSVSLSTYAWYLHEFLFNFQSETIKKSLEDEITKLRTKISELEKCYIMKCEEAASAIEAKEKDTTSLMKEISVLRNEVSEKVWAIYIPYRGRHMLFSIWRCFFDWCYLFYFLIPQNRIQIEKLETELASSKRALDEQYKRWRSAQDNYERQVLWGTNNFVKQHIMLLCFLLISWCLRCWCFITIDVQSQLAVILMLYGACC